MAYSYTDTVGDGATVTFPFTFKGPDNGFFRNADIEVELDGVPTLDFTLTGPTQVTFAVAPGDQVKIRIMRKQPDEAPYTDFQRGNAFGQANINRSFLQQLYLLHEFMDGFKIADYYEKQHLNMGTNYRIINLADGVDLQDAVTVAQAVAAFEDMDAIIAAAEAAAAASAAAALVSENNASTSAEEAAASAASIVGDRDAAAASAAAALVSENAAAVSEANAATSETGAEAWKNAAAASAAVATTKAASAAASEVSANNSASAAATSESNAATSENNAAISASEAAASAASIVGDAAAAAASAAAALVSENNAATSESNAASSESAAAGSASAASVSAAAALVSENSAETHKDQAGTFAGNALVSQLAAGISAGAAAGSASAAAISESNAAGSASAAAGSASAAAGSASAAATSASNAATSEANAAQSEIDCQYIVDNFGVKAGDVFFERRGQTGDSVSISAGVWTTINMSNNVNYSNAGDTNNNCDFVAPSTGLYHFDALVRFNAINDICMVRCLINAGDIGGGYYNATYITSDGAITLSFTLKLVAAQVFTIQAFAQSAGNLYSEFSFFSGYIIRPL